MQIQTTKSNYDTGSISGVYFGKIIGYNNWRVIDMVILNLIYVEEEKVYKIILHRKETRMNERIHIGTFGEMRTNDEATQGYY